MIDNQIKFSDIISAQNRLKGIAKMTTLLHSKTFSTLSGCKVFMKLENLQTTGSFKLRGAYNKIATLSKQDAAKGVVAASAGNHAQGVAYSATKLGIKSTIFMPIFTPPLKILATKGYGAEVVLTGESYDDAYKASQQYCKEHDATYIHPFNDPLIIAGQGTIGLEVHEQLSDADAVIIPIGGGGLIAGMALAIKEMHPKVKIIGVEAAGAASMQASFGEKKIVTLPKLNTIADGIAVKTPGDLTFEIARKYVDEIVTVNDTEIAHTTYLLLQRAKILAEPSGVASIAAALMKKTNLSRKNVVAVISGGNINMQILEQIIEKGMVEEQLRACIRVIIPDQPGELKRILSIIEKKKINIYDINHERSFAKVNVGNTMLTIKMNLQNKSQLQTIVEELTMIGLECTVVQ